jgi:hypothetical protein
VIRGGSWNNNGVNCTASNRNRNEPDNRNNNLGFRVLAAPSAKQQADPTEPDADPFVSANDKRVCRCPVLVAEGERSGRQSPFFSFHMAVNRTAAEGALPRVVKLGVHGMPGSGTPAELVNAASIDAAHILKAMNPSRRRQKAIYAPLADAGDLEYLDPFGRFPAQGHSLERNSKNSKQISTSGTPSGPPFLATSPSFFGAPSPHSWVPWTLNDLPSLLLAYS